MDLNMLGLVTSATKIVLTNLLSKPSSSEKILDPMSCIIRIGLLNFKKDNTKIGIHNNSLQFQYPSVLQGTIRWANGDGRTDLHYLHNPILKAIEWYDINRIRLILEFCKKGLLKLKRSYSEIIDSNLVCHSLNYYIKIIDTKLKTETNNNRQLTLFDNVENDIQNRNVYNNDGIKKLKFLWCDKEIKLINDMFVLLSDYKQKKYNTNNLVDAINIIVKGKDEIVQKLIIKLTSTLSS